MTATETPSPTAPSRKRPAPRATHPLLETLFQHYPRLFGARFLPLKRGIYEDLLAAHPEAFKPDELKLALSQHTRSTRYLEAVAELRKRHDLEAKPVEDVAPEHVYQSIMELYRRRQARGREGGQAWLDARLLAAVEAAGLDRATYEAQVRPQDPAVLDAAFSTLAERGARREALVRAYQASGRSVEAFAEMYGMKVAEVRKAVGA